ncbi:MAG TPA: hypothetical protein VGH71_00200 [Gammaproteobacteria bacterium]|jgi:hypothetical protein
MSALNPLFLTAEFRLLWSVRQLLRGVVIGFGVAAASTVLVLFAVIGGLGLVLDTLQERTRSKACSHNPTHQGPRGLKGGLS